MINIPCGKCGSMNIGKNGTAAAGASEISLQSLRFLRDTRYSGRETEEKRGACGEASERTRSAVRDRACGPRQPLQSDISYKKKKSRLPDRSSSEYGSGRQLIAIRGRQPAQLPGIGEMRRAGIHGSLFLPVTGNVLSSVRITGKSCGYPASGASPGSRKRKRRDSAY